TAPAAEASPAGPSSPLDPVLGIALPPPAAPPEFPGLIAPPDLTPFASADRALFAEILAALRKGEWREVDRLRGRLSDPVARKLAEWTLIRSGQQAISYQRILAFMRNEPDWPTQTLLQRRAEEAMSAQGAPHAVIREFFAARKPATAVGRLAFARTLLHDGRRDE